MKLLRALVLGLAICTAIFAAWAGCAHPQAVARANPIDVYLIGGQSNATGQGYLKNLPKGFVIDTRVLLFNSGRPHLDSGAAPLTWVPLRQASEDPTRFGPEIGFGNELQKLYPNRKIALIKHAHSGTNLYAQWNPDMNNPAHPNQYGIFVDTVEKGLQGLRDQGYTPVIRGMIWHQGENDADAPAVRDGHAQEYAKNLAHLIASIREHFHAPDMVFVYAYVLPSDKTAAAYPGRNLVHQAEHDVGQNSGSPLAVKGAFVVATDDLNHRADDPGTRYPNDYIHIGTSGQLMLGERMADKMHDNEQVK